MYTIAMIAKAGKTILLLTIMKTVSLCAIVQSKMIKSQLDTNCLSSEQKLYLLARTYRDNKSVAETRGNLNDIEGLTSGDIPISLIKK